MYHRSHGGVNRSCEFHGNHEADDMSDNGKGRSKRFKLKSWHVTLAAIVAVVGLIALYIVMTRARLDRRLEALRAAGYPTTLAELAEYNKLPAGTANAAGGVHGGVCRVCTAAGWHERAVSRIRPAAGSRQASAGADGQGDLAMSGG